MAWLQKKLTVVYVDGEGRRVPKGTAGARRQQIESDKWYGCWKEGDRKIMVPLARDKQAAQALLTDLIRQRERGQAGLIDPYKPHLDRPVLEHLKDYLAVLQSTTRSDEHHKEVERVLTKMFNECGMKALRDLTADRVQRYIASLDSGASTRNKHRTYVLTFCNYLVGANRLPQNPITRFSVRRAKPKANETRRQRRALKLSEIRRLLDVVAEYPVQSALVNRGGRKAKVKPRTHPAKLKPATLERLRLRGKERRLLYRIALLTALRRKEISRLRVSHLELDREPLARINLPGNLTKSGRPACIPLVSSLAQELRAWIKDTGRQPNDPVLYVPSPSNLSKIHKAHLALAGIKYQDDGGRYADFHAMRKCVNVLLRKADIPAKERQLFLRHGKLELTTETYDDDQMTATEDVIKALEETDL